MTKKAIYYTMKTNLSIFFLPFNRTPGFLFMEEHTNQLDEILC